MKQFLQVQRFFHFVSFGKEFNRDFLERLVGSTESEARVQLFLSFCASQEAGTNSFRSKLSRTSLGTLCLGVKLSNRGFAVASIPILAVTPSFKSEGSRSEPPTLPMIVTSLSAWQRVPTAHCTRWSLKISMS